VSPDQAPILIRTRSPEETRAVGEALGRALLRRVATAGSLGDAVARAPRAATAAAPRAAAGAAVALTGPLGAGKTCLVQGLARGLGVSGYVRSPTFTLVHEHCGPVSLYHVDLYRLGPADLDALGLEEILDGPGVVAIEWAEHAEAPLLPRELLRVEFTLGPGDEERLLTLTPAGERYRQIAEEVAACVSSP
jgi:tRNA threonylcarbamoyladenosine biosynthesis protein TsaE